MQIELWSVYIQPEMIRIGCQYHKADEWFNFDDDKISKMHSEALNWWNKYKELIKQAHQIIVANTKSNSTN